MTAHVTSKVHCTGHGRPPWWEAHCTCGWERNVQLEVSADWDITRHLMAVEDQARQLARAYAVPLPDDGITP